MSEYMFSEAGALLNSLFEKVSGSEGVKGAKQGESLVLEYAQISNLLINIKAVKLGRRTIRRGEIFLSKDMIFLEYEAYKEGLPSIKRLASFLNDDFFVTDAHKEIFQHLERHSFYRFCEEDGNARNAFALFIKHRAHIVPDEYDYRKVVFYGIIACGISWFVGYIKSHPRFISQKKDAIRIVIAKLNEAIDAIDGSDLDYGARSFLRENYMTYLFKSNSESKRDFLLKLKSEFNMDVKWRDDGSMASILGRIPVIGQAFRGVSEERYYKSYDEFEDYINPREVLSISNSLRDISEKYAHELQKIEEAEARKNKPRVGSKELVRRAYMIFLEGLMDANYERKNLESIRVALDAGDGIARELIRLIDDGGVSTSQVKKSKDDLVNEISLG